jgi:hypothetical protein
MINHPTPAEFAPRVVFATIAMSGAKSPIWFWLITTSVGVVVGIRFFFNQPNVYPGIPELLGAPNSSLYRTVDDAVPLNADDVHIVGDANFRFTLTMIGEAMPLRTMVLTDDGILKTETFNRLRTVIETTDGSDDYTTRRFSISRDDLRTFEQSLEDERFVEMKAQYVATNIQCGTAVTLTLKTSTSSKSVHCSNHFPKKVLRIWKRLNALHGREIPANVDRNAMRPKS